MKGRHLVSIQPELSGVYILAEQDMKAPINKGVEGKTIYNDLKKIVDRTVICEKYSIRHLIITGEAELGTAIKIPSIALNIPEYQEIYQQAVANPDVLRLLIDYDCWEGIPTLNFDVLVLMLDRMSYIASVAPELWKYFHREYYRSRLSLMRIEKVLPQLVARQFVALNTLLPNLIKLPPDLDTLGIRLWYTEPNSRAYLLGCDVVQGIPSDEIISEKLQTLQKIGIEAYVDTVTGVYLDEHNKLTGRIGEYFFSQIKGKKLLNTRTSINTSIGSYYVSDLIPIIGEDQVEIVIAYDFLKLIRDGIITSQVIIDFVENGSVGSSKVKISQEHANEIKSRLLILTDATRGLPARMRLVEIMSNDMINY
jgi:hypothetical protein